MKPKTKFPTAFTLIELLVVVAILGILAALVSPAVASALKSGEKMTVLNQIRQISTLAVTYGADNNGELPDEGGEGVQSFNQISSAAKERAWYNVLPPLGGLKAAKEFRTQRAAFYSPASIFFVRSAKYPKLTGSSAYFAYAINSQLMNGDVVRFNSLPSPARTALFAEAALPDEKNLLPAGGSTSDLGQPKVRDKRFVGRYNGTGIIGFADGHSEIVSKNKAFDTTTVIWEIPQN